MSATDPVQAVAEALEVHQVEYLMDVRWDCGCYDRGYLPTLADALRHQAEAAVAAARPAIEREAKAEAWDEGFDAGHQAARAVNPYRVEREAQ